MLRRVRIKEVGDTNFLMDETVEKTAFVRENEKVIARGGQPAVAEPLLLGITKASSSGDSFISASSFQETTKVLTEAAHLAARSTSSAASRRTSGMGRLIPAGGTGSGARAKRPLDVAFEDRGEFSAACRRPSPCTEDHFGGW